MSRSIVLSAVGIGAAMLLLQKAKSSAFVRRKKRANSGLVPASPDAAGAVPIIIRNKKGVEIYVRRWDIPDGVDVRGLLVMVHGDLLTSEFFEDAASALTSKGFTVYSYDQVGYGLSGCKRGVENHIDSFSEYSADLGKVVDFARSDKPGLPCFLYGEDLGATVALAYTQSEQSRGKLVGVTLGSLMLECPPLEGGLSGVSNRFFPLANAPKWKATCDFEELFPDAPVADAAKALFDARNPATVRKVSEIRKMCGHVHKNVAKISSPVLLLHGNGDKRNDQTLTDEFQETIRSAGCSVFYRPYPESKHGLLHDADGKAFPRRDMEVWMIREAKETKVTTEA